jgi:hypothetical protein
MQGRLHATFAVVTRGVQPVGSILGGVIASIIGLSLTLVVSEIGMLLAVLVLLHRLRWDARHGRGRRPAPAGCRGPPAA